MKLLSDIKYLENNVFTVNVNGVSYNVEFKLEALPNDMKMLAFLAGELSNSAYYFSTFGNVNKQMLMMYINAMMSIGSRSSMTNESLMPNWSKKRKMS